MREMCWSAPSRKVHYGLSWTIKTIMDYNGPIRTTKKDHHEYYGAHHE